MNAKQRAARATDWAVNIKARTPDYFEGRKKAHDWGTANSGDEYWRAWWIGWLLGPVEALEQTSTLGSNPLSAYPFADLEEAQTAYLAGIRARIGEL